jgi:hypothetical protein
MKQFLSTIFNDFCVMFDNIVSAQATVCYKKKRKHTSNTQIDIIIYAYFAQNKYQ